MAVNSFHFNSLTLLAVLFCLQFSFEHTHGQCIEFDLAGTFASTGTCELSTCDQNNQALCVTTQTAWCGAFGNRCPIETIYETPVTANASDAETSIELIRASCPNVQRAGCESLDDLIWDTTDCECPRCRCNGTAGADTYEYTSYYTVDTADIMRFCAECQCMAYADGYGWTCSEQSRADTVAELTAFTCDWRRCAFGSNGNSFITTECEPAQVDERYCGFQMSVDENFDSYSTVCYDSSGEDNDGQWGCFSAIECDAWGASDHANGCVYAEVEAEVASWNCIFNDWDTEYWNVTKYYSCCSDDHLCNDKTVSELTTSCAASPTLKLYYEKKIACERGARQWSVAQGRYFENCELGSQQLGFCAEGSTTDCIDQCDALADDRETFQCQCDLAKIKKAGAPAYTTAIQASYDSAYGGQIATYNAWIAYYRPKCGASAFACKI